MLIKEQIGALTFTPEVKRVTFNGSQVREFRDTMEKMLAVIEAAKALRDDYEAYEYNGATKKYDLPCHEPQILERFDNALALVLDRHAPQEKT